MRYLAILLLLAGSCVLAGCCEEAPSEDLGVIEFVTLEMGSWNSCDKYEIQTNKTVVAVCIDADLPSRHVPLHWRLMYRPDTVCRSGGYSWVEP